MERERIAPRASATLAVLACLATIAVAGLRLFTIRLGVGITDESLYVAIPYRFFLGDKPFVNEISPHQPSGMLVYPLVRLFLFFSSDTTGIILFIRYCYLLLSVTASALVFKALRAMIWWPYALLISASVLAFVPWNIPSLSYNTLACSLFTIGTLVLLLTHEKRLRIPLVFAGMAHGLSIFAYPPMFLAVAASLYLVLRRSSRLSVPFGLYVWTTILVAAIAGSLVGPRIVRSLPNLLVLSTQGGGLQKLASLVRVLCVNLGHEPLLLLAGSVLFLSYRWDLVSRLSLAVRMFLPLAIYPLYGYAGPSRSLGIVAYYSILSFPALLQRSMQEERRFALEIMTIPSFVAGLAVAYSSNNGIVNAGVGLLPAFIATSSSSCVWLTGNSAINNERQGSGFSGFIPAFAPALLLLTLSYAMIPVYGEPSWRNLSATVTQGPFKGLQTSSEQARWIEDLQQDLRRTVKSDDSILFYDNFPAGYLMTSARPATNTVWSPDPIWLPEYPPKLLNYLRHTVMPSLVVHRLWHTPSVQSHPLEEFFAGNCTPIVIDARHEICRPTTQ